MHKSEAELLYFIRRIIRHLRNGLPFGILKCTTGYREKRQPFFIRLVTVAENYLVLRSPVKLVEADTEAADTNDKILMLFGMLLSVTKLINIRSCDLCHHAARCKVGLDERNDSRTSLLTLRDILGNTGRCRWFRRVRGKDRALQRC